MQNIYIYAREKRELTSKITDLETFNYILFVSVFDKC